MKDEEFELKIAVELKKAIVSIPPEAVVYVCKLVNNIIHSAETKDTALASSTLLALCGVGEVYEGCKPMARKLLEQEIACKATAVRMAMSGEFKAKK